MNLFKKILENSNSSLELETYLNSNLKLVNELSNSNIDLLIDEKNDIEEFILLKRAVIEDLDFDFTHNKAFIAYLFNFCERLNLVAAAQITYSILENSNIIIGSRLEAAKIYLLDGNFNVDYIINFEQICIKLEYATINEEDNEQKVIETFFNYFLKVIKDTNMSFSLQLVQKLRNAITNNEYTFLKNPFILQLLDLDYNITKTAYNKALELLGKSNSFFISIPYNFDFSFLIEENTNYVKLLNSAAANFHSIRQISVDQFALINDSNVFYSLQRGVKIIENENQLFSYLKSYGKMHHTKLVSSFKHLPDYIFNKNPHCIDWGCGQGMASMTLLEYLNNYDIAQSILQITLIEPSQLALKRASLHVSKFTNNTKIINTINKDLDSLVANDFLQVNKTRIHLFSNILDMDVFSLSKLIDLIKANFPGENYFLCVSPYITDLKTARIDSFVNAFSSNDGFEELFKINSKSDNWINGWTRVIRVFKASL